MKTITEFNVTHFKKAEEIRASVSAEGKTPEEIQQAFSAAITEQLKLEGDKLTHFLSAIELLQNKTTDLKRMIVFTLAEGEKAPSGAREAGGAQFLIEYYPPIQKKGADGRPAEGRGGRGERGGRGGDRDKKKRGGPGRGGERGGRGGPGRGEGRGEGRGPGRGPGREISAGAGAGAAPRATEGAAGGGRGPRRERAPRPEYTGPNKGMIIPRASTGAASPAATQPAAAPETKPENSAADTSSSS